MYLNNLQIIICRRIKTVSLHFLTDNKYYNNIYRYGKHSSISYVGICIYYLVLNGLNKAMLNLDKNKILYLDNEI